MKVGSPSSLQEFGQEDDGTRPLTHSTRKMLLCYFQEQQFLSVDTIMSSQVKKIVREGLFPHIKWISTQEQLQWLACTDSISMFVTGKLNIGNIQEQQVCWSKIKIIVDAAMTEQWNNVTAYLTKAWFGESSGYLAFNCSYT